MDFSSDQSGRYLFALSRLIDAPEFVKEASVAPEDLASLERHQFADPAAREFPIDEPGHIFLSYGYLKVARLNRPEVEQRVKRAAELLGVTAELAKIDAAIEGEISKSASTVAKEFAVVIDFEGAPEHMKQAGSSFYPINTPTDIEESARQICADRNRMPSEVFIEGCQNIVKAAQAHNLEARLLPSAIWEFGEERFVDYDHVQFQAEKRAALTGDQMYIEISKSAAEDLDTPVENWIEAWRQADRQNDVDGKPDVKDAHRVFYSGVDKKAFDARMADWVIINGAAVPKQAVAKIPADAIAKLFPGTVASGLTDLVKRATVETGTMIQASCQQLEPAIQQVLLQLAMRHA